MRATAVKKAATTQKAAVWEVAAKKVTTRKKNQHLDTETKAPSQRRASKNGGINSAKGTDNKQVPGLNP